MFQKYQFLKSPQNHHLSIGFGTYGEVRLARNIHTQEVVAVKLIYNKKADKEIELHSKIRHPNIVSLLNYNYIPEKAVTVLILEYMDGGTLFERIKNTKLAEDKKTSCRIFRDVCQAVGALHQKGIMHRDIKPENILLTKDNSTAKLCDFGFAAKYGPRFSVCGTYEYMCPEILIGQGHNHQADIWALGILLFQMIAKVPPFRGTTKSEVIAEMKKQIPFMSHFEEDQIELVRIILRVNPQNRPSIQQILDHRYFQRLKNEMSKYKCLVISSEQNDSSSIRAKKASVATREDSSGMQDSPPSPQTPNWLLKYKMKKADQIKLFYSPKSYYLASWEKNNSNNSNNNNSQSFQAVSSEINKEFLHIQKQI